MSDLYFEICEDKILRNLKKIKDEINDSTINIMAVVKSNAYGHGSVEMAQLIGEQIDYIGVTTLQEAIELRSADIEIPILIMGPTDDYLQVLNNNLIMTIVSLQHYKEVLSFAEYNKQVVKFHLKVDTGMNRFGLKYEQLNEFINLYNDEYTNIEGVFSHFATTFKDNKNNVLKQKKMFDEFVTVMKENKFDNIYYHIANSENTIDYPDARYNMVRIGNAIYGPCNSKKNINLEKIGKIKAKIIHINEVKKDEQIGYGLSYKVKKDMKVGLIPFGYYDGIGLSRKPLGVNFYNFVIYLLKEIKWYVSRRDIVYYNNFPLEIVGKPNMQFVMVKIPENLKIEIGDEVDIFISPLFIKESIQKKYVKEEGN